MKLLLSILFCASTLLVEHVNAANILVPVFFSSKSHKLTYLPLLEELGKRGHSITLISPIPAAKPMKNVHEIFTMDMEPFMKRNNFEPFSMKEKGLHVNPAHVLNILLEVCNETYDMPIIKEVMQQKFDLIFLQPFMNECVMGLVYRMQLPFVMFTPTVIPFMINNRVGGHFPTSFTPNLFLGYKPEMTFFQRFLNFGMDMGISLYMRWMYIPESEKIYREKLGQDIPPFNEIFKNVSLVLSNGHFSLTGPKPYFPDVIDVGGLHSQPAKPIPKDMDDFLAKGKDGFILFSMGSATKNDLMSDAKRKIFLNVFAKLKQQVLWKWESETMPDLPKNVKLSKWLPQQDLLGRKDIRMFISHCGGGSTEESIYHGVPLVGIPMFGDQLQNSKMAKERGFLVELQWNELTEESLMKAIQEILDNPKYRENVQKLSSLFNDRQMKPLDLAVYWVEYAIRHGGAPHLRNVGRNLSTFAYHSFDVILTYLVLISLIVYLVYAIIRFVCRKVFCRGSNNKVSSDKKSK